MNKWVTPREEKGKEWVRKGRLGKDGVEKDSKQVNECC